MVYGEWSDPAEKIEINRFKSGTNGYFLSLFPRFTKLEMLNVLPFRQIASIRSYLADCAKGSPLALLERGVLEGGASRGGGVFYNLFPFSTCIPVLHIARQVIKSQQSKQTHCICLVRILVNNSILITYFSK